MLGKKAVVERELPRRRAARASTTSRCSPSCAVDKRAHFVIGADFVTTTDGTGIVHIAPAFGEDDMRVGPENGLPVVKPSTSRAASSPRSRRGPACSSRTPTRPSSTTSRQRGLLLGVEPYEHSYPFCWRCDTPLLYYAKPTWFIRTTAIKDQLIEANDDVNWYPEHIKDGRFGNWLANNVDWAPQPRALLGHAAARLAVRRRAHALRRVASPSCARWRPGPFRRIWTCTGPTSTTSS